MRTKLEINQKRSMTIILLSIKVEWEWKNATQGQRQQDGAVRKSLFVPADRKTLAGLSTYSQDLKEIT